MKKVTLLYKVQKNGVMQHDLYTWQLQGKEFIHLDEVDNGSKIIDATIKQWLEQVSKEQREEFINNAFEIFQATDADTLAQMKEKWLKNARTLISKYKSLEEESRKMMIKTVEELFKIAKNNVMKKTKINK